jgi:hypothetical protein
MNSKFLKLILTSASVLALAAVVSFAEEPAKKDGEKKCPNCPDAPAPKALIISEEAPAKKDCDKCPCPSEKPKPTAMLCADECPKKCDKDKKDAPAAPATAEDAPAKKDGEKKCPNCPDAPAPKA